MVGAISHVYSLTWGEDAGIITVFNSAGNSTTSNGTALLGPNEWNSVHNITFTITGNTSNASTGSGNSVILQGSNNVTLSGTSNTVYISGQTTNPPGSVLEIPYAGAHYYNFANLGGFSTSNFSSSLALIPFTLANTLSMSRMDIPLWNTQASGTGSSTVAWTLGVALYSIQTGASSSRMSLVNSSTMVLNVTANSNSSSYSFTDAAHSTSFSITLSTMATGNKWFAVEFAQSLDTTGQYFWGFSSSNAGSTIALQLNPIMAVYAGGVIDIWGGIAPGLSSSAYSSRSDLDRIFGGVWSTTSAAFPGSIASSAISNNTLGACPICIFLDS
jgi:hypothetical protein